MDAELPTLIFLPSGKRRPDGRRFLLDGARTHLEAPDSHYFGRDLLMLACWR